MFSTSHNWAVKKHCPFNEEEKCKGEECMCWRFLHDIEHVASKMEQDPKYTPKGYCGLAGKITNDLQE